MMIEVPKEKVNNVDECRRLIVYDDMYMVRIVAAAGNDVPITYLKRKTPDSEHLLSTPLSLATDKTHNR